MLAAGIWSGSSAAEPLAAPRYRAIPAASFASVLSGKAEQALIRVTDFRMREQPVSNREYLGFVQQHPEWQKGAAPALFAEPAYLRLWSGPLDFGSLDPDAPVVGVSWYAAAAYCRTEQARLPSWYQWELVAAADEQQTDARQNPAWRARILKWYGEAQAGNLPALQSFPNAYGVSNMHGIIWEWVRDFNALLISPDSRTQGDPDKLQFCGAGAISLQDKENYAILMRVALLSSLTAASSTDSLGFRCAKDSNDGNDQNK